MSYPLFKDFVQMEPWPIIRSPFIVAEIGINHNGSVELAKQLIDVACAKGCNAVKFQKRSIDIVYRKEYLDAPRESPWGKTQRAQKEGLEFGREQYDEIDAYCRQKKIAWFASAWDIQSLHFLRPYDLPYNKVASAMVTCDPFVDEVISEGKLTFVGTGMCTYDIIDGIVKKFTDAKCPFILMHCVSEYPATNGILNLRQIVELRNRYKCLVGYSGHEMTMIPGVIAIMMGAVCIERHITIDHHMYGTDQAASLEPRGLETMMNYIRQIPIVLGDGKKVITAAEAENAKKLRYW